MIVDFKYIKATRFVLTAYEPQILESVNSKKSNNEFNHRIFNIDVSIKTLREIVFGFIDNKNNSELLIECFEQIHSEHVRHRVSNKHYGLFIRELLDALHECIAGSSGIEPLEFGQEWSFFLFNLANFSINPKLIGEFK